MVKGRQAPTKGANGPFFFVFIMDCTHTRFSKYNQNITEIIQTIEQHFYIGNPFLYPWVK